MFEHHSSIFLVMWMDMRILYHTPTCILSLPVAALPFVLLDVSQPDSLSPPMYHLPKGAIMFLYRAAKTRLMYCVLE